MPSSSQLKQSMSVTLPVIAGLLLTGCASNQKFATLESGACSAFPRPMYQVKGQTSYDQKWADETTEAGVAGCNWQRPKARPAQIATKAVPIAPSPKQTFKQRWLSRFFRNRAQ